MKERPHGADCLMRGILAVSERLGWIGKVYHPGCGDVVTAAYEMPRQAHRIWPNLMPPSSTLENGYTFQ